MIAAGVLSATGVGLPAAAAILAIIFIIDKLNTILEIGRAFTASAEAFFDTLIHGEARRDLVKSLAETDIQINNVLLENMNIFEGLQATLSALATSDCLKSLPDFGFTKDEIKRLRG